MKKEYIFVDFEMDVNCDENPEQIIKIGAIKVNNNGNIIDKFVCFSKLANKSKLYEYTTFLTGISNKDIRNADNFKKVSKDFIDFCGECTNIYNWGDRDIKSIEHSLLMNKRLFNNKKEFKKYNEFYRSNMKDFRKYLPKKYHKFFWTNLFKVAEELDIIEKNKIQSHCPIEDAIVLKDIFFKISKEV